jgi:glucose/arabinose dehydrogenase
MSDGSFPGGGVFVLSGGKATRLAGSPVASFGVAWQNGTLYVSALSKLLAWSGWNGTTFTHQKVIYTASKRFPGFNGLAFGPNGRLYVGVDVGQTNDHGPPTAPYQYDILSFTAAGKNLNVVAKGIRQPWQFAFPTGSSSPFVSNLGQDKGATNPPDFLLRVSQGDNFGFPTCNWVKVSACTRFTKPLRFFAPHSDVMGLAIIGNKLYMSEYGVGTHPRVISMPLAGGPVKPVVTGFSSNIVGLGTYAGWLYIGQPATGASNPGYVFRAKP